jgi:hypothetical protein
MISDASADDVGVFECVATSDGNEIKSRAARIRYYRPRQKPTIIHRFVFESDTIGPDKNRQSFTGLHYN